MKRVYGFLVLSLIVSNVAWAESGVAWRKNGGCWNWGGGFGGWKEKVEDAACKYCGDGLTRLSNAGPMWRKSECWNNYYGWKDRLSDLACKYTRYDGGCAFLGSEPTPPPADDRMEDPWPDAGVSWRRGNGCWNYASGWKDRVEDAACKYCGAGAPDVQVGPFIRKEGGCWNWDGRGWKERLGDSACKYRGCAYPPGTPGRIISQNAQDSPSMKTLLFLQPEEFGDSQ